MVLTIVIILILLGVVGWGGYNYGGPTNGAYWGGGGVGLVILILILLFLFGYLPRY
jgi:hypothetical protein